MRYIQLNFCQKPTPPATSFPRRRESSQDILGACKVVILYAALGIFLLCGAVTIAQAFQINAPPKVSQGAPFVVNIVAVAPTPAITVAWRDTHIIVPTGKDRTSARLMLAVPLDHAPGVLSIAVSAATGERGQYDVRVLAKARPVQRLTVDSKYVDPPPDVQERIVRDRHKVNTVLGHYIPARSWDVPFLRPVPGEISSQFGLRRVLNGKPRNPHRGLDFRGQTGQPILALADGQVGLAEELYFSGNCVYVNHGGGVFTAYLHMSEILVRLGQNVRRGDVLGLVGSTGVSTAPHLHLGLLVQGTPADPLPLLEAVYRHP